MSNHSEPSTPFTTNRYVRNLALGLVYVLSVACFMRLLVGNQANTMNYADQEQREHCGFSKKGSWGEMAEKSCMMGADGKCESAEACEEKGEEKTACEGDCANKADCKGDCAHKGECKGDCKGPEVTEDKEAAAAIHGEIKEVAKKEAITDKKSEQRSKKKSS